MPLLMIGVVQVVILVAHETRTIESTFPAADLGLVEIDGEAGGRVEVVGTDADEVRVVATIDHGLRRTGYGERIEGDRLVLSSSCPIVGSTFCRVHIRVEMPASLPLIVSNDAGSIVVSDIDADVDLRTDAGSVEATRIGGTLQARSDAGSVTGVGLRSAHVTADSDAGSVSLDFARAPTAVAATSDAGTVEVVVPPDGEVYKVTADSDAGNVTTAVATAPDADRTIVATSDAGSVHVRYATTG
ncbi:MAG TPA: hypothetical protein VIL36_23525 [Acidimicrobiales bacterium]